MGSQKVLAFFAFSAVLVAFASGKSIKDDTGMTIQATNNTLVPNITYTVDAVETLREACSIYIDEPLRASAFLELFGSKHPGNWSVVVGYTTIISHSTIYIEMMVNEGKNLKADKPTGGLWRIMN